MIRAVEILALVLSGMAAGGLVERWRWLRSPAAREWMAKTGERGRLL